MSDVVKAPEAALTPALHIISSTIVERIAAEANLLAWALRAENHRLAPRQLAVADALRELVRGATV